MADKPDLSDTITANKISDSLDHSVIEKPVNGKRPASDLQTDSDVENLQLDSAKRMKVEVNGLDHTINRTSDLRHSEAMQNGKTNDHADKTSDGDNSSELGNSNQSSEHNKHIDNEITKTPTVNECKDKPCVTDTSNHIISGTKPDPQQQQEDHKSVTESEEPEVITLSDSEDEYKEVLSQALSLKISDSKTRKLLKLRQDKLRAEENKLILLKKLKLSLNNTHGSDGVKSVDGKHVSSVSSHRTGNIPPPLKRGLHQSQTGHATPSNKVLAQQNALSHSKSPHGHQSNGVNSNGPPPLVNMSKTSSQSSGGSTSQYTTQSAGTTKKSHSAPQLTAEQKSAAAKLALKKQLEQSLQQITPPKPLPPEVNFLPSLTSGEFVCLIGMEEVVKHILAADQKDVKYVFNPFSCVQCNTDFTPVWKRDKPGSKNVICEKCITSNQKKVLKQEHTTKLKSAFEKALQKEQEIERRIASGSPLSDIPGLNAIAAAAAAASQHQSSSLTSSTTPSMPQLTPQLTSSHLNSASPSQFSAAQIQQHQALLQAQAAEQMRAMLAAQAMALPYSLYGVSNKQAADLQRQYLLDMINPNRSWKT